MKKSLKVLVGVFSASLLLTACEKSDPNLHTFREYLTVAPSNWNELTYQDANDTEIMQFISGSFFTFNFEFDAQGKIVDGGFAVEYDGAKDLEDVTEEYAGDEDYSVPEDATSGYAYKITLRDDLKWDDGTPIHAADFVYSMQEQENPLFKNYRADSYYNSGTVIHNAQNYVKQGSSGMFASRSVYNGVYTEDLDDKLVFDAYYGDEGEGNESSYIFKWFRGYNGSDYDVYFKKDSETPYGVFAIPMLYGETPVANPATMSAAIDGKTFAEIKADATLKSYWDWIIGWWQTDPGEELDFFVSKYTYPELSFDKVGLFVGDNENELVIVLDKAIELFDDEGELSYLAAYQLSSLPLVKKDLYEKNKVAPKTEGGLWTTTYNTSVKSSASWGPYKLTKFQAGKQFVLERNENWYGYNMKEYEGQYQTDRIICDIIPQWNTAWLAFQKGDIQSIGIDVSISTDYKNSSRAIFTPSDFIGSLQLQSDADSLAERSDASHNKMLLVYPDFRQAISLAIDRADYTQKCTTASQAGFGLFNSMHYYDVAHGGVYRNEDVAKEVICDVYGVNVEDYDSLDEAYAAVTGYNLDLARELLTKAYNQALADGNITETDKVVFTVGSSELTESVQRQFDYLKVAFETLAEGTPLQGRLTLELDTSFGTKWATDFRDGAYDICTGGWSGAAWDPGYFLLAYLSPDYMYSQAWDTSSEMLTFNPYGDENPEHEYTMSLIEWYNCLNGISENPDFPYNWSAGRVPDEFRLGIIAQLERAVLKAYYTVPLQNSFSASLLSYKVEYITRTYNTFMGYGGIRYLTYKYNDGEWNKVKKSFDYKK